MQSSSSQGSSEAGKKPIPQLALRFKPAQTNPSVARMADDEVDVGIVVDQKERWDMFYEAEQPLDDPDVEDMFEVKGKPKKHGPNIVYRRKQKLFLENQNKDMLFEARPVSLDTAEEEFYQKLERNSQSAGMSSSSSSSFRNVILKFVQIEGSDQSEVHIIPVSDIYVFRKARRLRDELHTEVVDKYKKETNQLKKRGERFKKLFKEGDGSLDTSKSKRGAKDEDEDEDTLFALRDLGKRKKGAKSRFVAPTLTENGADLDEVRDTNEHFGNEMDVRYADDEERHVEEMQAWLTTQEDNEFAERLQLEDEFEGDEGDEDDEEDEEEEGEEGGEKGDRPPVASLMAGVAAVVTHGTENVNLEMWEVTQDWTKEKKLQQQQQQMQQQLGTGAEAEAAPKSVLKRGRDDDNTRNEPDTGDSQAKKVRFNDGSAGPSTAEETGASKTETSSSSASVSSAKAAGKDDFDLSLDGVRRYIERMGGRVPILKLAEFFKPHIKARNKALGDKTAGKTLLGNILEQITERVEDPTMGEVLALSSTLRK